jgi:hypothetical protein
MLKLGIIGLGQRGKIMLLDVISKMEGMEVTALCDLYEDKIEDCFEEMKKLKPDFSPLKTTDYKEVINSENTDAILCFTAWESHVPISVCAMKAGKAVGCEVGGAYSVEDCFELVRVAEETGAKFMMLENCCFGRRELMALNMAKRGFFGKIVHCDGGYMHDLRYEVSHGKEIRHYRLRNYLTRNCENYPTHELGPIAKILNINRGNRMLTLTSTASLAAGLHEYILENKADDEELKNATFAQGDIITTVIKCAGGETIALTLDTTLPRYYSRNLTVRGTKAMYEERTNSVFENGKHEKYDADWSPMYGNAKDYCDEYEHPIWRAYLNDGLIGGHGGMDGLVLSAFRDYVNGKITCPVDVYDAASWMAITALSEESIAKGGAPVNIPDFTGGRWLLPRHDYFDDFQ